MSTNAKSFVIEDVKIFTGDRWITRGFVEVNNGLITEVGQGEYRPSNQNIQRLSRPNDSLVPGLIDAHIHALSGNVNSIEQSLRFGITTVCDMHNDPRDNAKIQELADDPNNKSKHADFKCAGLGAVVEGGWPIPVLRREVANEPGGQKKIDALISTWPKLSSPDEAGPFVREQVERNKASYIKMFHELGDSLGMDLPPPPMDVQEAVVAEAHRHGIIAVGHAFSYDGTMALLRAGVDGLTHIFLDRAPNDDFINLMLERKAHCNPTLCLCASQTVENQDLLAQFGQDPFAQKRLLQDLPHPLGLAAKQKPKSSIANAYESTKALYKAGVPLVIGTDASGRGLGVPYGLGIHMEMYLLAREVGVTPEHILKAATSTPADRFGFHDRGRIGVGKRADLLLVEGDIDHIITNFEKRCLPIKSVWREGIEASGF